MKLVIDDIEKAQIFSIIFQHLKHISEYVNLSLKDDKLYIQAMDSSKISVFEVHLLSSFFTIVFLDGFFPILFLFFVER